MRTKLVSFHVPTIDDAKSCAATDCGPVRRKAKASTEIKRRFIASSEVKAYQRATRLAALKYSRFLLFDSPDPCFVSARYGAASPSVRHPQYCALPPSCGQQNTSRCRRWAGRNNALGLGSERLPFHLED